jgi:hypothetical protein
MIRVALLVKRYLCASGTADMAKRKKPVKKTQLSLRDKLVVKVLAFKAWLNSQWYSLRGKFYGR